MTNHAPGASAPPLRPTPAGSRPRILLRGAGGALAALLLSGFAAVHGQSGNSEESDRSVLDGVYSEAQSQEGEAVFNNVCSACHATSQFRGTVFLNSWTGATVYSLYDLVSGTMPFDDPGALPPEEYAAVVAYMLKLNGYPAGAGDLPSERDDLDRIRIVRP